MATDEESTAVSVFGRGAPAGAARGVPTDGGQADEFCRRAAQHRSAQPRAIKPARWRWTLLTPICISCLRVGFSGAAERQHHPAAQPMQVEATKIRRAARVHALVRPVLTKEDVNQRSTYRCDVDDLILQDEIIDIASI